MLYSDRVVATRQHGGFSKILAGQPVGKTRTFDTNKGKVTVWREGRLIRSRRGNEAITYFVFDYEAAKEFSGKERADEMLAHYPSMDGIWGHVDRLRGGKGNFPSRNYCVDIVGRDLEGVRDWTKKPFGHNIMRVRQLAREIEQSTTPSAEIESFRFKVKHSDVISVIMHDADNGTLNLAFQIDIDRTKPINIQSKDNIVSDILDLIKAGNLTAEDIQQIEDALKGKKARAKKMADVKRDILNIIEKAKHNKDEHGQEVEGFDFTIEELFAEKFTAPVSSSHPTETPKKQKADQEKEKLPKMAKGGVYYDPINGNEDYVATQGNRPKWVRDYYAQHRKLPPMRDKAPGEVRPEE